jgi:DNA invertase Pin-like site-specific DNA recombinase
LSQEDGTPRAGEATATERQIADCRARADREGWPVAALYEDPDISASDLRRKRPEFERMLADLGDGVRVDAILCYKLDRLLRHPKETERLLDLADARGISIVSLSDPGIDLTTPNGRFMFRLFVSMAKAETETMSLRIRRKVRDIAETGRPNGGGIRPFGLTAGMLAIVPAEAELVAEAAERIIAGASVHSIVAEWNARGVRTPGRKVAPEGRKWEVSSLKRMLTAPRIVGDRTLHGAKVGSGVIPALLDRETWDRLRAVLAAPRGPSGGRTVRRHYLTGIAYCGLCGAKLVARPDARGTTRYVCAVPRGCGRITVAKSNLEPLIAEAIAIRLESDEFRAAVATRQTTAKAEPDLAQLRDDEAALDEAASAYFVDRTISKPEYARVRAQLEARIETGHRRLARSTADRGLGRLATVDVRGEWDARAAAWRSEVARTLIERVTVNPAPRRGTRFDPSRIDVEWRV